MIRKDIPTPHLVTMGDLFDSFDVTKLKGEGNIRKIYKCCDKNALARKIFFRYLHTVFTRMCQGGVVFEWSHVHTTMQIGWQRQPDKAFKNSLKWGNYKGVDVLASNFTNYELRLRFMSKGKLLRLPVVLSNNYRKIVIDKINSGYKYC